MSIENQFNLIAAEYDGNRRKFIPCFDDFYESTTAFIASNVRAPKRVVDLGAGTGLLTYYWYQRYPDAEYVLVDVADEMLDVARKRFAGVANISFQAENYARALPDAPFDAVISALSVHHLEDEDKAALFAKIHARLPDGGLFANYDQFCAEQPEMNRRFDSYWENQLEHSGLTDKDMALWRERRKLDRECSVEKEIALLKNCGFKIAACVYSCQKFSVVVATK